MMNAWFALVVHDNRKRRTGLQDNVVPSTVFACVQLPVTIVERVSEIAMARSTLPKATHGRNQFETQYSALQLRI